MNTKKILKRNIFLRHIVWRKKKIKLCSFNAICSLFALFIYLLLVVPKAKTKPKMNYRSIKTNSQTFSYRNDRRPHRRCSTVTLKTGGLFWVTSRFPQWAVSRGTTNRGRTAFQLRSCRTRTGWREMENCRTRRPTQVAR